MPFNPWIAPPTIPPLFTLFLAIAYALYILAYPPRHRALAFALFCIPVTHAFIHQLRFTPWFTINDTLGRMMYIWTVYMSYAFLIVRYEPDVRKGEGWRVRLRQAGKVLFTRRMGRYFVSGESMMGEGMVRWVAVDRNDGRHHLSRNDFATHHVLKALLFFCANHFWTTPSAVLSSLFCSSSPSSPSFSSSLAQTYPPDTLAPYQLYLFSWAIAICTRTLLTWDTCIGDMLYFDSVYSLFAILWVCIFRLDEPDEWGTSLFGDLADCWTVRQYWGVYWHDYIRASFTAHTRLITRGVLRWENHSAARRAVESACVFGMSGLAHALVVYVQTEGRGEVWSIALWYSAQMLPIMVEGVVQTLWGRSRVKAAVRCRLGVREATRVERIVGYAWVLGWMLWSVPRYLRVRDAWEREYIRQRYPGAFA